MKEQAKQKIKERVELFKENIDDYKKSTYKEAQVREQFINPFFKALGWDVGNKEGLPLQATEVVLEYTIKDGRSTRVPDYSFRIGGKSKFFVEAKKPAVNIKEDVSPSFQLRGYAWSAELPLSILTDFEEFSVFDCRIKPNQTDKTDVARINYIPFNEYIDRFDEIYDVFSKEAVLKGSFDKYAQSLKGKRGTEEVGSAFLKEIESWRELLAKNIALRNPDVSIYELNYAVQKIIDRIIFLRICEDRGIEHYGQLQTKAKSGDVYTHLLNHFKLAESKYNSSIFDFDADKITTTLRIDDKVLKTIIQSLYYPKSPYAFSVLGVEILGNVYEQFLGKVIRLTAGHQAEVETKPEVKKAGGVYYTPQYIVDYIVKNTVGKLIEGKTPEEIAEIKILDPACGSGSFLIGAYAYLLRYHLDWYTSKSSEPKEHKKAFFQVRENEWYLTTAEKKRILLDNIFGVDIDPQAVEVTKLSLLLKVLENESRESIDQQVKLGLEGVLPNLEDNIKCGNSLIEPDFYDARQATLFDEEEMRRINVFDWNDDVKGFGRIMKRGGFYCVIGNPPYLAGREWPDTLHAQRPYFKQCYSCMTDQYDLYALFIQKASELLQFDGYFGFITPTTWLNNEHYLRLREWLIEKANIERLGDYRDVDVFSKATVLPIVIIASRVKNPNKSHRFIVEKFRDESNSDVLITSVSVWEEFPDLIFNLSISENDLPILKGMEGVGQSLSARNDVRFGVKVYQRGKGKPPQKGEEAKQRLFESNTKESDEYYPYIRGKYVKSWFIETENAWLKYGPHLAEPRSLDLFKGPRILVRRIVGKRLVIAPTEDILIADQLLHTVKPEDDMPNYRYTAALLGSRLIAYYFKKRFNRTEKTFPEIRVGELRQLPIHTIDFSNPIEKAQHDKLVALVDNMLELQKKYHETRMERDKELYERQIKIVDTQIGRLVYELYGLTEEEIGIVEKSV